MEFWKVFKILAITFGNIFWGALSDWMSKSVQESPSDSAFVQNNSAKVKIKPTERAAPSAFFILTRLKRVLFTNYWQQFFWALCAEHLMWDQCWTVWFALWFLSNLIFWCLFKYKIVIPRNLLVSYK